MAAISCYQPCRSHLAQPARCLNDDDLPPLTIRRRQLYERCREPRRYEPIPPEVSVKRTRDELTKYAAQTLPVNRRLNVDSGWSKVEEVRKKFEGSAAVTSYSRSFESPPRRRLADSLFASFKLPRSKDNMARSMAQQPKRKSAVELLAESKAFYVKSETVRDTKQELPLRVSSGLSQAIAAGGCHLVSSSTLNNDACCNPYATVSRVSGARRAVSAGEGLQNTLRRLLEHSDSRENVYSPPIYAIPHKVGIRRDVRDRPRSQHNSALSGTSSSGTSGSKPQAKSDPGLEGKLNRPRSFGDARVFFPESFVIPKQRPNEILLKSTYSIPSPHSSPESAQPGSITDQMRAISPPAQYAHSTPRYIRSNSHSQTSIREEDLININSHKSLPDLHTQARTYIEHNNSGTDTIGRSPRRRRYSTHQRTASCSSKGTRSNHSSLISSCDAFSEHPSPGEENYQYNSRCGSSFARDSGGSSGHYTQPGHMPSDSNVATHRDNGYPPCCPWPVSAPPQFQDGASPPVTTVDTPVDVSRVGIHFQASAPPPQFQDDPVYEQYEVDCYKSPLKCLPVTRNDYNRDYSRYHEPNTELINKQPQYQEPRSRQRLDDSGYVNTSQLCPAPEEVTSPLGTFKRQRCLRYKQRRPRQILRSKSDISDRYRRPEGRSPSSAPCEGNESPDSMSDDSDRLQSFFSRLGLDAREYDTVIAGSQPDSPVYFSSCSSVDSNQLPDYTVQGPAQKQIYRNTEPPSVVERNARIVKWLCQCRKIQQNTFK